MGNRRLRLLVLCLLALGAAFSLGHSGAPWAEALDIWAIDAGGQHTCALTASGGVKCWGANDFGQLGDGVFASIRTTPVDVCADAVCSSPLSGSGAVTAGDFHTCGLTSLKAVTCWGANAYGQLGNGTTSMGATRTPVNVCADASCSTALVDVAAISAGGFFTCALTNAGGVKCWGQNGLGQVGNGTKTTNQTTPVDVCADAACAAPLSSVLGIATGFSHACALTTAGRVKCWGLGNLGQIGDGQTTLNRTTPVDVCADATCAAPLTGVVAISTGDRHTCALTTTNALKCWGDNQFGQLGDGQACSVKSIACPTPVDVCADATCASPLTGVAAVAGGASHTCSLSTADTAKCWGRNNAGQIGDGTLTNRTTPVDVCADASCAAPLAGIAAVADGNSHTCALTEAAGVKCWGRNIEGQLGDGQVCGSTCDTPVDASGLGPKATDADQDGCWAYQEFGSNPVLGGKRNAVYYWDYIDQWIGAPFSRDQSITVGDLGAVVARIGTVHPDSPNLPPKEGLLTQALTPPAAVGGYHASSDRNGSDPEGNVWDLVPPDGAITVGDIGAVVGQFGHTCA